MTRGAVPAGGVGSTDPHFARLLWFFSRNGCVRNPQPKRLEEGYRLYKKGWEVRIVVENAAELAEVRQLLAAVGLTPGSAYAKGPRIVQPVYGKEAVERFTR